jgi:hypothetical protein
MLKFIVHFLKNLYTGNPQRITAVAVLGLVICSSSAIAQSGAGAIQGTVQDSTGAVVAEALIHVVNQKTGRSMDTKSNGAGFYSVPSLFIGNYTLTFSAPGMKKYETSISLQVGQTAVINPLLSAGSVTEKITVNGTAIQLATYDNPTISSVLDNSRINQLPMNGRNLLTLTGLTTPGLEGGGTRANGNLGQALEYVQDGVPLSNRNYGGATILPDPDAVQEVRMETANSGAQFATPATGIITTKSGTNQLHGSLFETMRNNYIGIAKARQDPSDLKVPHYIRNEFGGSIGGPIVIPKLYDGKNKSFFFVSFERLSLRSSQSQLLHVPTQAMRDGDFSGLVNSSGQLQVLYDNQTSDPVTFQRQPFVNNQIPKSRLSPLAKKLYELTPLPSNDANPLVSSNLTAPAITNQTLPTTTFRLDQNFNQNNRAYLRFTSSNYTALNPQSGNATSLAAPGFPAGTFGLQQTRSTVYSSALGYTHVFSPTFFSETILSNQWEADSNSGGNDQSIDYRASLGLPQNFGPNSFQIGTNLFNAYVSNRVSFSGSQKITNIDENLTKILGRHQLAFGGRYRYERLGVLPDQTVATTSFNGMGTGQIDLTSGKSYKALPNTGDVNADFFLGAASNYNDRLTGTYFHYHDQEFDTYFQDNFHVNSRLTVNLGIRWEVHPAAIEESGQNNGFDIKNKAIVLSRPISELIASGATTQAIITNLQKLGTVFETSQQAGLPKSGVYNSNFTFSPRIGIAYTPFGTEIGTVIRGGYGRYIYPIPLRNYYATQAGNAPYSFGYDQSYTAANQSPDGQPNYLLRAPQTVIAGANSAGVVNTGGTDSILPGIAQMFLNPHFPPNYVTQANVTLEQPLKWNSVLRLTYLHNHGSNLDQYYYLNHHPSDYVYETRTGQLPPTGPYASVATGAYDQTLYNGSMVEDNRNGFSNDDSLQLNYQHLYKSGYAFQAFYVYSRAFRAGGNTFRDSSIYPINDYAPGLAPISTQSLDPWAITQELNRFQNYMLDSAIPEHHVSFNGIVDIPIGRGKRFFGNVNRFVNELIGGFQIAGDGNIVSQYFKPSATNWGQTNPLHVYKHARKVNDCRSGVCHPAYQYFNGFLSPLIVNASKKGITGIPSDYQPYQSPINMTQGNSNYLTNNVPVTLANGKTVNTAYSPGPGLNPFSKTFLSGPFNYTVDLSLFKVFPITERVNLRVNVDAFNALNVQGYNNPGSDGIESLLSSHNIPRQVQFTARLTF